VELYKTWHYIIINYLKRQITKKYDKLLTLSELVNRLAVRLNMDSVFLSRACGRRTSVMIYFSRSAVKTSVLSSVELYLGLKHELIEKSDLKKRI
jgi:hypothetical protein